MAKDSIKLRDKALDSRVCNYKGITKMLNCRDSGNFCICIVEVALVVYQPNERGVGRAAGERII